MTHLNIELLTFIKCFHDIAPHELLYVQIRLHAGAKVEGACLEQSSPSMPEDQKPNINQSINQSINNISLYSIL